MTTNKIRKRAPTKADRLHIPAEPDQGPARDRYKTLYLISHRRHLDSIPDDPDGLVVTTEWSALQACRERNIDSIHTDWIRKNHRVCDPQALRIHQKLYSYIACNDANPSVYKGVEVLSLSTNFLVNTLLDAVLHDACIRYLCAGMKIQKIVAYDLSADFHGLGLGAKEALVAEIGSDLNLKIDLRWDIPKASDAAFFYRSLAPRPPGSINIFRSAIKGAASYACEAFFRAFVKRNKAAPFVYMFISVATLKSLVKRHPKSCTPIIPFSASPKSFSFLYACFKNGIIPVRQSITNDQASPHQAVPALTNAVERAWKSHPASGIELVYRSIIREHLLVAERLSGLLRLIDETDDVIRRFNVSRVVTGDATAPVGQILRDLADKYGIGIDESLNGMFLCPFYDRVRDVNKNGASTDMRELALGPSVEKWLSLCKTPLPSVSVGYPALGELKPGAIQAPSKKRVLVLPIYAWHSDTCAWSSKQAPQLVDLIRTLASNGIEEIHVKLHPGIDNFAGYQWLIDHFELPCSLYQHVSFAEQLDWADLVIGPAGSSTFLETIAIGKPFYVFRPQPTAIPDSLLEGAVICATPDEVCAHIERGIVPDRHKILNAWGSMDLVDNSAEAFWDAVDAAVASTSGEDKS